MFVLVGANQRSAAPVLRSLFDDRPPDLALRLAALRDAGVAEAVWLVTCDRLQVIADAPALEPVRHAVAQVLAPLTGESPATLAGGLIGLCGEAAYRHFFAVAASLDSQVVGEPHVLGQLKHAVRAAGECGMIGPCLAPVVRAALATAKRVRTETRIGEGPTSMAAAAVEIARTIFDRLAGSPLLLMGASEMGLLLMDRLRAAGATAPLVWTPREALTERLATRFQGHAVAADGLEPVLPKADIVITGVGSGRPLIGAEQIDRTLRRRRRRPMLLFDCAVPTDIDPAVAKLDEAFLYGLGDLEDGAQAGRARRSEATAQAWHLVDQAVGACLAEAAERQAVPTVVMLRRHFEAARSALLAEHDNLSAAEATRLLVNRLLHAPSATLRRLAREHDPVRRAAAEQLLSDLFAPCAGSRAAAGLRRPANRSGTAVLDEDIDDTGLDEATAEDAAARPNRA